MEIRTRSFGALVDAAHEQLASGPAGADALAQTLENLAPPVEDPDEFVGEFLDEFLPLQPGIAWHPDGFYRPDVLYTGTTFTTIITETEIAAGRLDLDDLPHVSCLEGEKLLGNDYQLERTGDFPAEHTTWLSGPQGWLSKCRPGELCGLEFDGATLRLVVAPEPWSDERLSALATSLAAACSERSGLHDLEEVVCGAMLSEATTWKGVIPPLDVVCEAAGLARRRGMIGDASTDWDLRTDEFAVYGLGLMHGLDESDQRALMAFSASVRSVEEHGMRELDRVRSRKTVGADVAAMLSQGRVAAAAWDLLRLTHRWSVDRIRTFAEALEARTTRADELPAGLFVLALCDLHDGAMTSAEQRLREARRSDPDHGPTTTELGWLAFYRSRFTEAYRLLEFSPDLDDELADLLEELARPGYAGVGRNERCPCGSGRKFKQCHASATALAPLADRVEALMTKASHHGRDGLFEILESGGRAMWDVDASRRDEALRLLEQAGLGDDTNLFDGGTLARFVDRHGELLPADELALARSWLKVPRTVLVVIDVEPADGRMTARDLVRDAELSIHLTTHMEWLDEGTHLVARPLPVDDDWILFDSAHPINEDAVPAAVEILSADGLSGLALAEGLLADRPQPPDRVMCAGALRSSDTDGVASWIDAELEPAEAESPDTMVGLGDGSVVIHRHNRVTVLAGSIEEYESMVAAIERAGGPAERLVESGVEVGVLIEEATLLHPDADEEELRGLILARLLADVEGDDMEGDG